MNHQDHVQLLRPANVAAGGLWADLGAGTGAFTLALRELTGREATIYAVDKDSTSLSELERSYERRFGEASSLRAMRADFAEALELPPLDGAVMANSLHFFSEKEAILRRVRASLKPGGLLLVIEYNVDRGNPWVPFPLSYGRFQDLAVRAGFSEPRLLATHPSGFLREFYSAAAIRPNMLQNRQEQPPGI